VDQSTRAGARAGAEVALLHQHRAQAAHRRVAGHARARDPAADNQEVRGVRGDLLQCRPLRGTSVVTMPPIPQLPRPSTWFLWHAHLFGPGVRVLDLACGEGRHSLAAAAAGATVVGVDKDETRLARAKELAGWKGLTIDWRMIDLEGSWPDFGSFDAVLMFNYLDRTRLPLIRQLVAAGGLLLIETFLATQRSLGWGPTSEDHLLQPGEIARLVSPFRVLHGREVLEPVDAERWRAVASVLARNA
jgi:2-polyprenyl-3-methyl-5-hydroxy-6-metoxy-1,4-benzoquinol methylase